MIPEAVARLRELGRGEVRAALGPCVHPCCYEFGRDVLDRVVSVLDESVVPQALAVVRNHDDDGLIVSDHTYLNHRDWPGIAELVPD